ncbi:MAG: D-glycero-beta-D-manno-heptose 1-phosphate adenylyltransferase [Nitrospirota bacterium]|nr:D-glycero-beta-D-manno-heptose 1-phosphate adenylyltransferase [Nitrospirota bacterium]
MRVKRKVPDTILKIYSRSELVKRIAANQKDGKRVVFTNGCFDLLHIGHTRYLAEAKGQGDCLVVGINSDESVRQLAKGSDRPIITAAQRAEVVAALGCVDYVTIFDEPDPLALIQALRPNILVKGGDWATDRIVGKEFVEAQGGSVQNIPLVPDISTTTIVQRILAHNPVKSPR